MNYKFFQVDDFFGAYKLLENISKSEGATSSCVYRIQEKITDHIYALKILTTSYQSSSKWVTEEVTN